MSELPSYASLAGVRPETVYGLLAAGTDLDGADGSREEGANLVDVVDRALSAAADGQAAADAARPRWLDGLALDQLRWASTRTWSGDSFLRVRLMERLGLVRLEADDTYVLAMVGALGPHKAAKLREDPDLVERALWRVFEVEGGGEISLTNVDRFCGDEWRAAFVELSADGTLDRDRILDACLAALGRDFAAYRARWFSATYLALEPTVEESTARQAELRRLLGAAVPATVGFALTQLLRVERADLLDRRATLEALPPATLVKPKGTVLAALTLAGHGRTDHPESARDVARTALGHPNPDVQRAAAALLADLDETSAVVASADDLTPSVRRDLGVDRDHDPEHEGPRSQPLRPVPGPASAADLAERTAGLLEDASDALELEAVLATLVDPGVEEALAPLRKRAETVVARGPNTDQGDAWLPGQVARLVLQILGEPAPKAKPDRPAQRFVVRRIAEIRASSAPLLATPDLAGGWVSPAALVERLARNPHPRHHDLIAALLRLHPDGREEALGSAGSLPSPVRFALDGHEPRRRLREGPGSWWVAAERSRAGYSGKESPELAGEVVTHTWEDHGRERRSTYARFAVTIRDTERTGVDRPTAIKAGVSRRHFEGGWALGGWIPTLAAIWPHEAEHFLALTCRPVLESPDWAEHGHDVPRVLDALAQHPGHLGTLAVATLASGISAGRRDHRLHAVDAFLDLAVTGRIPPRELAAVMARHAPAWPANRWAESLASVAQAPGGSSVTVDLLTHLLPQLPADHRGLNQLLVLLRDELIRLDRRVTDPALTTWLGGFTGGSAVARTARLLLG